MRIPIIALLYVCTRGIPAVAASPCRPAFARGGRRRRHIRSPMAYQPECCTPHQAAIHGTRTFVICCLGKNPGASSAEVWQPAELTPQVLGSSRSVRSRLLSIRQSAFPTLISRLRSDSPGLKDFHGSGSRTTVHASESLSSPFVVNIEPRLFPRVGEKPRRRVSWCSRVWIACWCRDPSVAEPELDLLKFPPR